MKRVVLTLIAVCAPAACFGQTAQPVAVSAPPLAMTLVLFAGGCACVVFGFQVFSLIRGGQLSKSWLLLTGGFLVFALSQLLILLSGFGVISNSNLIVPAALMVMSGLFCFGLWMTKRTLS